MRELIESERKAIASLYSSIGAEIPRHLLPDVSENTWRRYELEKELIPPCDAEEYEKRILRLGVNFDSTELEARGSEWLGGKK